MTSSALYVYSIIRCWQKNNFSTETHRKSLRVAERFLKVVFFYYFKKFDNQASQAYSQAIQVEFGESRYPRRSRWKYFLTGHSYCQLTSCILNSSFSPRPSSIFYLLSSIFYLLSSIFHLPSSIFHLPSSIFCLSITASAAFLL